MRQLEKPAFHSPLCLDSPPFSLSLHLRLHPRPCPWLGLPFLAGRAPALLFGPRRAHRCPETLFTAHGVPLAPGLAEETAVGSWEAGRSLNLHDQCRLPLLVCGRTACTLALHRRATNGREQWGSLVPV